MAEDRLPEIETNETLQAVPGWTGVPYDVIQVVVEAQEERAWLIAEVKRLREAMGVVAEAIPTLERHHVVIDDCWYSCPASGDCCDDRETDGECNCGADRHNAQLQALLDRLIVLSASEREEET